MTTATTVAASVRSGQRSAREVVDEALAADIDPRSATILAKLDAPLIAAQYAALAD